MDEQIVRSKVRSMALMIEGWLAGPRSTLSFVGFVASMIAGEPRQEQGQPMNDRRTKQSIIEHVFRYLTNPGIAILVLFIAGALWIAANRVPTSSVQQPDAFVQRYPSPTYRDALQVLVDDIDEKLRANIFGQVTVKGSHAFVVVEESYFVRLAPDAQRLALESVRDQWFSKCYGKRITFKTWNGTIVAEF